MKNGTIGNRTRNLPTFGAVPQLTAPPSAHVRVVLLNDNIYDLQTRKREVLWSLEPAATIREVLSLTQQNAVGLRNVDRVPYHSRRRWEEIVRIRVAITA